MYTRIERKRGANAERRAGKVCVICHLKHVKNIGESLYSVRIEFAHLAGGRLGRGKESVGHFFIIIIVLSSQATLHPLDETASILPLSGPLLHTFGPPIGTGSAHGIQLHRRATSAVPCSSARGCTSSPTDYLRLQRKRLPHCFLAFFYAVSILAEIESCSSSIVRSYRVWSGCHSLTQACRDQLRVLIMAMKWMPCLSITTRTSVSIWLP